MIRKDVQLIFCTLLNLMRFMPKKLADTTISIYSFLQLFEPWLAQTEPAPPDVSVESLVDEDAELDPAELTALREALASNRPRPARQLFAKLHAGLSRRYGPAATQAIATPLAALDFPAALNALDAALSGTAASPNLRPPD